MTEYVKERQAQKEKSMDKHMTDEFKEALFKEYRRFSDRPFMELVKREWFPYATCLFSFIEALGLSEEYKEWHCDIEREDKERHVKDCTWKEFYDGIRKKSEPEETEDDAAEEDDTDEEADAMKRVKWHINQAIQELKSIPVHPAEPKNERAEIHYIAGAHGLCMKCGSEVDSSQDYCPACGQALDWEGIDEE